MLLGMAVSEIRAHVRSRVPMCCMAEPPAPGADLGWNSELGDLLAVQGWRWGVANSSLWERGLPSPPPWGQHSRLCAVSTCPGMREDLWRPGRELSGSV